MALFRYETGASKVKLTGLANANFGTMDFNSGAGDYTARSGATPPSRCPPGSAI